MTKSIEALKSIPKDRADEYSYDSLVYNINQVDNIINEAIKEFELLNLKYHELKGANTFYKIEVERLNKIIEQFKEQK